MFQKDCHTHTDCNQHHHPHQVFFNELMREFDPKDPANKNRTFEKMVVAANRKHLNPGEQSFHYYIDKSDNKVHGFIAVGNINDRLPHIIISDNTNGKESALEKASAILKIITDNNDIINDLQKQISEIIDNFGDINKSFEQFIIDFNELREKVEELENNENQFDEEDIKLIKKFIINNKEFIEENDTSITDIFKNNMSDELKNMLVNDNDVQQIIKELINNENKWILL